MKIQSRPLRKYRETEGEIIDGDIVFTCDNPYFINGAHKNEPVITYEKGSAPLQKITLENQVKTDIRGLGTGVGGFSNCATIIETMKAQFLQENQKSQYDELCLRKKLLREIVGQEIDRIKGTAAPVLPSEWKHFETINEDDSDAVKAEKYRHNSMVLSKKPYFFRYLYPELNQKYKRYENAYNTISLAQFGQKFKKILGKPDKTPAELQLVKRFYKFSPLLDSPCTMNVICHLFEHTDFRIQYDKESVSLLPTFEDEFEFNSEKFTQVKKAYNIFSSRMQLHALERAWDIYNTTDSTEALPYSIEEEDYVRMRKTLLDLLRTNCWDTMRGISSKEFLYYCHQLSKVYKQFNWGFAWDMLEDGIVDLIPEGETVVPVEDPNGQEYLGKTYILKSIPHEEVREEEVS